MVSNQRLPWFLVKKAMVTETAGEGQEGGSQLAVAQDPAASPQRRSPAAKRWPWQRKGLPVTPGRREERRQGSPYP